MFENWQILKNEIEEKREEYFSVAQWCNENGYFINETATHFQVEKIPEKTQEEINLERIDYLKSQLSGTDYKIIKIAEGSATKEEYATDIAERQSWRAEINALGG